MSYKKIGIIGLGVVGGALQEFFKTQNSELFLYDKFKKIGSPEEVNNAEVVFICVPTPFNELSGFDLSAVEEAVSLLINFKVVVIKSTVLPGTTESFQAKYPQHKFLMNPEFLREVTALDDMLHPDRQLVGYTLQSRELAKDILALLPAAPYTKILPSTATEMVKYFNNTFLATKVILANEIYDICERLNVDYGAVAEAVAQDVRIGTSHLKVNPSDRGYGGMCLPKDVASLAQFVSGLGIDSSLIEAVNMHNGVYRKKNIKDR